MTHLWVRAEERDNEARVGLTPEGAARLIAAGLTLTVEDSAARAIPIEGYREAGATIAPPGSWREAPPEVIVFGLKELTEDDTPLVHRHIMFGHAYKGQPAGQRLLRRFRAGGGALYDLEYLTDEAGRRLAAFGYWAGYAGAAVSLMARIARAEGGTCGPVSTWPDAEAPRDIVAAALDRQGHRPHVLIIGAKGRVGTGAGDFCEAVGLEVTRWDMAETAHGGPFPEVLEHEVFLNCILATPGVPVFVPETAKTAPRALTVIGDIACDPTSDFSPVKVYDAVTDWARPVQRVHADPPLDVMAIDNLPALLPRESSEDFAAQLLPVLLDLDRIDAGAWARAKDLFQRHTATL
ncbi:saccharopine dehydrogenase [Roseibacterium sp. SDUM158016]|uniref:saccharopine dehydrogenase n=1 Tax=Roseicyclus sediminis TaxID=2980997 RepID=UPI0021D2E3B7|nr:saccharopine dehydrogenase [Roseibacterium sp. SDUM158016]MCU4651513.1 saccharopine dehydrogenase [Roseibacterium sp. SDUM158016]